MMDEKRISEETPVTGQETNAETDVRVENPVIEEEVSEVTQEDKAPAENSETEVSEEVGDKGTEEIEEKVTEEVKPEDSAEVEKGAEKEDRESMVTDVKPETVKPEDTDVKTEESENKEEMTEEEEEKADEEMSMGELMEKYEKPVKMGQIIKGKIIQLDDKEAIIALVGAGNDGKLSINEVSFDDSDKLTDMYELGQEIEAKVIRRPIENDSFFILSVKEVQREASKEEILKRVGTEETVNAKVREAVKGGLVAFYKGHRIFIPASHVDVNPVRNLEDYVGKDIELSIIEAEERRGSTRIVGSRKQHLLKSKREQEQKTWDKLEVGQTVKGKVARLTDFGAFINVDGVDGLLHISEMSYGKIPKPSSILKAGEEVEVKIIGCDRENQKLSLSLKALMDDPWKNIQDKYPNGSIVLGKVVRFTDFGAFIELEPGVDGLAHISQLSHSRVEKPSDVLKIGDTIKVMVLDSNENNKKVSLSVKAVE